MIQIPPIHEKVTTMRLTKNRKIGKMKMPNVNDAGSDAAKIGVSPRNIMETPAELYRGPGLLLFFAGLCHGIKLEAKLHPGVQVTVQVIPP